jgi:hypothetical protein
MPLDLGKVKAAESPSRMSPSSSLAELRGQELVKTARDMQKLREDVEQLNVEKEELADDKMSLFQSLSQMRDQLDKQVSQWSCVATAGGIPKRGCAVSRSTQLGVLARALPRTSTGGEVELVATPRPPKKWWSSWGAYPKLGCRYESADGSTGF